MGPKWSFSLLTEVVTTVESHHEKIITAHFKAQVGYSQRSGATSLIICKTFRKTNLYLF